MRRPAPPTLGTIIALVAIGFAGAYALRAYEHRPRRRAALSRRAWTEAGDGDSVVRQAGPEAMRDPPRRWDRVDEDIDESFPASDPPATY